MQWRNDKRLEWVQVVVWRAKGVGHSDGGKTVMATYAHVWHDDDARTRSAVEAMLTDVG